MKNKKALYILIPLLIFIWSLVAVKIIKGIRGGNSDMPAFDLDKNYVLEENLKDTIYPLNLKYQDPFLKNNPVAANKEEPKAQEPTQPQRMTLRQRRQVQATQAKWPEIKYGGVVENSRSKYTIALIQVGQKASLMKEGDVFEKIRLEKLYADSVVVAFEDQKKTVQKN